jgi:hypothetical protein
MPRSTRSSTRSQPALGSLTQTGARAGACCAVCGSGRVTRITMSLTDGSPVDFTSCHECEHRGWHESGGGDTLTVDRVLEKTRKV